MSTYEPPFHDPAVRETALRRGLLDESESLLDAIDRVADALIERDAGLSAIGTREFATSLRSAMRAGRVAVSSQLMAAAGRDNSVAACTVLPTHGRDDATRIRRAVAEVRTASYAGMGCGLDLTEFDDPVSAVTRINDAAQLVHTELASLGRRPPALMVTCAASHADAASDRSGT